MRKQNLIFDLFVTDIATAKITCFNLAEGRVDAVEQVDQIVCPIHAGNSLLKPGTAFHQLAS